MTRSRIPSARLAGALLLALALPLMAQSPPVEVAKDDPSVQPSEMMPRASKSLLLDIVRTAAGDFAVGERGNALNSSDGKTWTQLPVPTRSTLTAIATADGQLWAAGHDGVIVHSADGGQHWQRQRVAPWSPDDRDPSHGLPILDLMFTDASNGYAVGAFSLLLETHDGGVTWTPQTVALPGAAPAKPAAPQGNDDNWTFSSDELQLDAESDPHFNAIARAGSGALVIVGERGTFLRSRDAGASWQKGSFPYQGSMFGVLAWEGDHILAFGLRGNAYESMDLGATWRKVDTGTNASLMGGQALPGGGAVLVGANGTVLVRSASGQPFVAHAYLNAAGETPVLSGVQAADNGDYVLIGDKGADLYHPQ